MFHSQNTKAFLSLGLCMGILMDSAAAQSPSSSQAGLRVKQLEMATVLDRSLRPVQIDFLVRVRTSGTAVSKLTVFYRNSAVSEFSEVPCRLSPDLKYHARIVYAESIEYYFLATPVVGAPIRFGDGRVTGLDLKPLSEPSSSFSPRAAAALAGAAVFLSSLLLAGDEPVRAGATPNEHSHRNVYIAVGAGAAVGVVTYLIFRHKRPRKPPADVHSD